MMLSPASRALAGPLIKIERAKRHVRELEADIRAFIERNPYRIVRDQDAEAGRYVYRVHIVEDVPACLSATIGDIVHNLRSALDQLVCQLVLANRRQVRTRTGFPVGSSVKEFETDAAGKIQGVSAVGERFIHRLKPYKGGREPFWVIHELNRLDKHKAIVPVGSAYKHVWLNLRLPVEWQTEQISVFSFAINPGDREYPLKDGTELFICPTNFFETHNEPNFTFEVAFGEGQIVDGKPVLPAIQQLVEFVERVIGIAERSVLTQHGSRP
jgi:hypothetical protein